MWQLRFDAPQSEAVNIEIGKEEYKIYNKNIYILHTKKGTILQLIKVANKFNFYISSNYIKIL